MDNHELGLVRCLPQGSLDIVGDIHGEFEALKQLLWHLGYNHYGEHPQGRRLVFVGDFCDRGPHSPQTLFWIKEHYLADRISVVLGNHEINILAAEPKDGSGWFFEEQRVFDYPKYQDYALIQTADKASVLAFLNQLPIALEREDIRIIHAAWLPQSINQIKALKNINIGTAYRQFETQLSAQIIEESWYSQYLEEQAYYESICRLPDIKMPILPGVCAYDLYKNQLNPIRLLTSGPEMKADQAFYAAGRWRFTTRYRWWQHYQEQIPVVIGHYWRLWTSKQSYHRLFPEPPDIWLGKNHNVFCTDFSVGGRWQQRLNIKTKYPLRLAALRWPERVLVFDNGEAVATRIHASTG